MFNNFTKTFPICNAYIIYINMNCTASSQISYLIQKYVFYKLNIYSL